MHFVLDLWSTLVIYYGISGGYFGHGRIYILACLGLPRTLKIVSVLNQVLVLSIFTNIYFFSGHAIELVIYTPVIIFFSRNELG